MSRRRRNYGDPDPEGWRNGTSMVIKIGDIDGDCTEEDVPNHQGWINVLAWSWGASRSVADPVRPKSVRKNIEKAKKELLKKAGVESSEDEEDEKNTPEESGYGRRGRRRGRRSVALNARQLAIADALEDFTSDAEEFNKFDDEEVAPRVQAKVSIQDLSFTKYVDISSPDIYLRLMGQKKGVECILRVIKLKDVPEEKKDGEDATKDKTNGLDKDDNNNNTNADKKDDAEEKEKKKPKVEVAICQELVFSDCFITSVSTGGSGGEDRLTENCTINFSRYQHRYTDYTGSAPRGPNGKIPTKAIYYDGVRNKAGPVDEAIKASLKANQQLNDVQSIVMGYL